MSKPTEEPTTGGEVTLDLDDLERDGGSPPPFAFKLEGKRFLASDPQEVDWQDLLASMNNPIMFLRKVIPAEDHLAFFGSRLPSWKLQKLMAAYNKHYGLPSPGDLNALPR